MKASLLAGACALGLATAAPASAQHHGHGGSQPPPAAEPSAGPPAAPEAPGPIGHRGHDEGMDRAADPEHEMTGALGPYAMTREASGTSWQPDSSVHGGIRAMRGRWMLMGHGLVNGAYSRQEGPRGDGKAFVSGMVMGAARRDLGGGALQLRAMLSPDPLMGKRGYPLHLAAGETANGVDPLIDRQHPHELVMELSASFSLRLGGKSGLFLYGGLPGAPAFGPPAFMHRQSIQDSPEAPITHHWLDSTHVAFGVVTAGLVLDRLKLEASRFRGREPDEHRYDIEAGALDSTALRLSFNPTADLSLQASWAELESPEQLEPGEDQIRWSASAIYPRRLGGGRWWSTTLAWGRRSSGGERFDALVVESAVGLGRWTVFGRAEYAETEELLPAAGHHGPTFDVGKVSLGAVRDFRLANHVAFGVGGLFALNFVPAGLEPHYGGDPKGAMAFVRLKID